MFRSLANKPDALPVTLAAAGILLVTMGARQSMGLFVAPISQDTGLDITRIILAEARKHLTEAGVLVVEIGHNREALEAAYPDLPFIWLDTQAGNEYVFLLNASDLPD